MNLNRGADNLARDLVERRVDKHALKSAKTAPLEMSVVLIRSGSLCGVTAYLQAA